MNKRASILILFMSVGMFQTATALEPTRLGRVEEGKFSFSTGLDYQEGDYGSPDSTSLWRVPFSISYREEKFSASASMPLLYAASDGAINVSNRGSMSGAGGSGTGGSATGKSEQQTVSGIGDIVLSGSYHFTPDFRNAINYRLTGIIKLGTADENKGLGTGENDIALEGGVKKSIDEYTLSGTLGYEIIGDSAIFDYDNVFYGQLGLSKQLAKNRGLGASLYYAQASSDNTEAPLELSFFYRKPVSKNRDIYFFFSKGLSDGSPDFSVGGSIQFYY